MISRKKLLAVLCDTHASLVLPVAVSDLCWVGLRIGKVWEGGDKGEEHLWLVLSSSGTGSSTQQTHNYWLLFSLEAFGVFIKILHRGPLSIVSYPFIQGHIAGGGGSVW